MSDLTEKWKNGELEDGMYYMENTSGIIGRVGHSKAFPCYNVKQILAPVPSYEEWQKLNQLLGKCYRFLRLTETKVEAIEKVKRGLVKEIDEVLK